MLTSYPSAFTRIAASVALTVLIQSSVLAADPLEKARVNDEQTKQVNTINYIRNGGFTHPNTVTEPTQALTLPDNRIPGWMHVGEWYVDESVNPVEKNARALICSSDQNRNYLQQAVVLEPGQTYTLSAWFKSTELTSFDADSLGPSIVLANRPWNKHFQIAPDPNQSDWHRRTITFEAPESIEDISSTAAEKRSVYLVRVHLPKEENGTMWISGIQLEQGS